jgi:hypothetical protein
MPPELRGADWNPPLRIDGEEFIPKVLRLKLGEERVGPVKARPDDEPDQLRFDPDHERFEPFQP